jgi:hypothetical protein
MFGRLKDCLDHNPAIAGATDNPSNILLGDALKLNPLLGVVMDVNPKYWRLTRRNNTIAVVTHPQTAQASMQGDMRPVGTGSKIVSLPTGGLLGHMRG